MDVRQRSALDFATLLLERRSRTVAASTLAVLAATVAATLLVAAMPLRAAETCPTTDLVTGKGIVVGTVCVSHDAEQLTVTYEAAAGWALSSTSLAVAADLDGIPLNPRGHPVTGQFPSQTRHDPPVGSVTHEFDLAGIDAGPGATLVVAAYAEMRQVPGPAATEGAWGDGVRFVENGPRSTYFTYTLEVVEIEPPDREFATIGNTLLEVGVPASGHPAVQVPDETLLDGLDAGASVTAVDETTVEGGSVTWDADGTFTYAPPAGFTGEDSFTYTVALGAASGTGTVTVEVEHLVWYVHGDGDGDGRSHSPLGTLAGAEAASGSGDTIFVYAGATAYDSGIALKPSQTLLGEAAGLTVAGHDLVAAGARPSIAAASGNAIGLASDTTVEGLDVTGAAGGGLVLAGGAGAVTVTDVDVSGTTGDAVHVSGGEAAVTLTGVEVTNATGHAVRVDGLSGGSFAHDGAVTDTGGGISLSGNTGSTMAFTGVLDIATDGSTAFGATGGGTVTATASGSTLDATGARALHVSSTTIGAAGLHFDSISASDAVHGIEVATAGSGPLVVAGDGSTDRNGAGGVISGMSSHGVTVSSAGPVTLRNMDIEDNGAVGVRAQGVGGLTLVGASLTGNTDDQNNPATRNSVWLRQVTGSVLLENVLVRDSVHNQVDIENTSGTVAIEVLDSELRDNGINSGLQVEALGTSNVTLEVSGSTFAEHHATAVHAFARNSATLTVDIDGNTFEDNNLAVNLAAQHTATLLSTVTGNETSGHPSHSINATVHEDATHEVTVAGNTIDGAATVASVGIRLVVEDDSVMRALVEDNTVAGLTSGHGVRVLAREDSGQLHLVLEGNHVASTSSSPAYSMEILHTSTMCAAISGNTGASNHPTRDLLVDLFDAGARGDFEGAPLGQLTQAELEAHLAAQNPGPRIGTFVATPSNAFGVAAGTCERPS